jgi:hypothetical protein
MRKVFLGLVVALLAAVLVAAIVVAHHYRAACAAADRYMSSVTTDGPWARSKVRLVLDAGDDPAQVHVVSLHWVFRFRRVQTADESKRIYATFSGDRAWSYRITLDPAPLLGSLP